MSGSRGAEALKPIPHPQLSRTEIKREPGETGEIIKYWAPSPPLQGVEQYWEYTLHTDN